MRTFDTNNDVPIGYLVPKFPSLYWPINDPRYNFAFLYYITDIWKFTLYWTLIFNAAFYGSVGVCAALSHRRTPTAVVLIAVYLLFAGVQGFIAGTVAGFLIGAIYRSGLFAMSTWIPLCVAVVQILFDVVMGYSMMGSIM